MLGRVALWTKSGRLLDCAALLIGCDTAYPEVVVVNELGEPVLVRGVSFNGCKWEEMLANDQSTAPGRCLTGRDQVHFQRFDAAEYCQAQVEDDNLPGLCSCDTEDATPSDPHDLGLISQSPLWFNYQTVSVHRVEYGSFYRFVLRPNDLEQDFSVLGPYGH